MRFSSHSKLAICTVFAAALATSAAMADSSGDLGIDLKELEGSSAGQVSPAPATNSPAIVPATPVVVLPPPNPMPLQWVPNGAPKDSELMDSFPLGASFSVAGIANQGNAFVAIVEYKGNSYIVQPGTMVPDQDDPAFQVRAITAQRVEAFDPVMRRIVRRSLPPSSAR